MNDYLRELVEKAIIQEKELAQSYKEERETLAEEMNQISEALFGYTEGSFNEIIQAIEKYKNIHKGEE